MLDHFFSLCLIIYKSTNINRLLLKKNSKETCVPYLAISKNENMFFSQQIQYFSTTVYVFALIHVDDRGKNKSNHLIYGKQSA